MKDEIKEILDILKDNIYVPLEDNREYKLLDKCDDKLLLDYITNLQEKYERMKENAEILSNGYNDLEKRNEKAIEFVKKESKECYTNQPNEIPLKVIGNFMWHTDKLLNILQGEENDN